jgi:hypothetical protein
VPPDGAGPATGWDTVVPGELAAARVPDDVLPLDAFWFTVASAAEDVARAVAGRR